MGLGTACVSAVLKRDFMFSLQKFFCRDEKFFDLIEALAQSSSSSAKTLSQVLLHPDEIKSVDEIVHKRRQSKELNDEIAHELCVSFVTPFEREDIEALSSSLTKISKTTEKFVSQYYVFKNAIAHEDFRKQAQLIDQSSDLLGTMVKQLRHKTNVEEVREMNTKLRTFEAESDQIMLSLLQELFSGSNKTLINILATKNLQELQEKLMDRFREAGNIVFRVVLKYS